MLHKLRSLLYILLVYTQYKALSHAGNSSLPSTSQELAEIFGTSDDEDDVDFPFSLSVRLPGELSLPNTDTKKFDNLLGNELFLNTFHDTLSGISPVPVSISQNLKATSVSDKGGNSDKPSKKGEELTGANTEEKPLEQSKSTEVKVPPGICNACDCSCWRLD